LLIKAGAEVQVIMTPAATGFISPLTLGTLSKRPVFQDVHSGENWNNHVEVGLWADAMVVAPLTANTLARMANGIADNMLVACYLSAKCPVFFAPAMDLDMWKHPSTRENVRKLLAYGNRLLPVGYGELASGLIGEGRMAEPEEITAHLERFFAAGQTLSGHTALVTAGPTYEPLDPVRFIGNHSSGKMGVALARSLADRGASVHLLLGPSREDVTHPNVEIHRVQTAQQMYEAAMELYPACSIAILAAAVADYRPASMATEKIKKQSEDLTIHLERTPDIAASLGNAKKEGQWIVGFALETEQEEQNARKKLEKKNFDLIVLNSLRDPGAGFHVDTNKVCILSRDNKKEEFELKSKQAVAEDIVEALLKHMQA
jgi:phosphopantothenoylcysteine decarboxylase/phosphopantothenate--cysteine ligase